MLINGDAALAQELLDTPQCLLDEFTKAFLRRFSTTALLLSRKCTAFLVSLGVFIRFEICRIECRHAYLRKFAFSSLTRKPTLEDISARYLLLRSRLLEHFLETAAPRTASSSAAGEFRRRKKGKRKGDRTGGGGAQRSFMSKWLRSQPRFTKKSRNHIFKRGGKAFKTLLRTGGPELDFHRNVGKGMAVSHASRGGHKKRRAPSRMVGKVSRGKPEPTAAATSSSSGPSSDCDKLTLDIAALGERSRMSLRELESVPPAAMKERREKAERDIKTVPQICRYVYRHTIRICHTQIHTADVPNTRV